MLRDSVCRESPDFEGYTSQVRSSLAKLRALEHDFSTDCAIEIYCPGVREQLQAFLQLAEKHAARVLEEPSEK